MLFDLISSKAYIFAFWVTITFVAFPSNVFSEQFRSTGTLDTYLSPNGEVTEAIEYNEFKVKSLNLNLIFGRFQKLMEVIKC